MLLRPKTGLKDMIVELDPGTQGGRAAERGRRDPGRPDAARRQPRRDPRRAGRRHARLPDAAAHRRRPGPARQRAARSATRSARSSPTARALARVNGALAERRDEHQARHAQLLAARRGAGRQGRPARATSSDSNARLRDAGRARTRTSAPRCASCPSALPSDPDGAAARPARWPTSSARRCRTCGPAPARSGRRSARCGRSCARRRRSSATSCARSCAPRCRSSRSCARRCATCRPRRRTSRARSRVVNYLLNVLAYNPPGRGEEGYLFWLSWANHLGANVFNTQDAHGPIRRGLVVVGCRRPALLDAGRGGQPAAGHARRPAQRAEPHRASARASSQEPGSAARADGQGVPSFGRIAVMVVFALSCFGLLLFLWLAFGGPIPLKPKGYRFQTRVRRGDAAGHGGRRAHLRRPGRQGQDDRARQTTGRSIVVIEIERSYAPLPRDAQGDPAPEDAAGRDLRGADAGHARRPKTVAGERHARAARRSPPTVELDEIFRAFDPKTREAFQTWMQAQAHGDRRPRAGRQRRARQPRAVRRGHRRPASTS